jgi:hypothetical protein
MATFLPGPAPPLLTGLYVVIPVGCELFGQSHGGSAYDHQQMMSSRAEHSYRHTSSAPQSPTKARSESRSQICLFVQSIGQYKEVPIIEKNKNI